MLLRPAKGEMPLAFTFSSVQPFWSTLAIFTPSAASASNRGSLLAAYDQDGASDRAALAALFPARATKFAPVMVVENPRSFNAFAPESDAPISARSHSSASSLPSVTQISGIGSTISGSSAGASSFSAGTAVAGNDSRESSLPLNSARDTAPRYAAGEASAPQLAGSTSRAGSQTNLTIAADASANTDSLATALPFSSTPNWVPAKGQTSTLPPKALTSFAPDQIAGNTWTGGGASNNWSDNNNWGGSTPGYGTLTFTTGGAQGTTSNNNSITAMNGLLWTGSSSWILNGSTTLSLFDNGGAQAKIENQSTGLVTINDPITFAANNGSPPNPFGEINAVNGDITLELGP